MRFKKVLFHGILVYVILSQLGACKKDTIDVVEESKIQIPQGFPNISFPADNAYSKSRWELGKKLFFDPILSIDSTKSCASCHKPELAFADELAFSPGVENRPGTRNSPSLANVAYQPYLLREGSVPTLEMQVLVPIQEHNEFAHNIVDIAQELALIEEYVQMSKAAYGQEPNPFVITRAIANFERSILSGNSNYDKWMNGSYQALNASEQRGLTLFTGKANCSACHSGFNFSNYAFENNGLDSIYQDIGLMRFTGLESDRSKFKVPSLRNVGLTAPYMHNGSIQSLAEVIEHYNAGGLPHKNKSNLIKPLQLSSTEKSDLLAFLISLNDYGFINDERWK